jgi:hypothetical protein
MQVPIKVVLLGCYFIFCILVPPVEGVKVKAIDREISQNPLLLLRFQKQSASFFSF